MIQAHLTEFKRALNERPFFCIYIRSMHLKSTLVFFIPWLVCQSCQYKSHSGLSTSLVDYDEVGYISSAPTIQGNQEVASYSISFTYNGQHQDFRGRPILGATFHRDTLVFGVAKINLHKEDLYFYPDEVCSDYIEGKKLIEAIENKLVYWQNTDSTKTRIPINGE